MKKALDNKKVAAIITIVLAAGLLISIIPIIGASLYAHPTADDFGFSAGVYHAVKSGGGPLEVLSAAFQQVKNSYLKWQGTYSAVFIFALQPAAFSENLYFLTTVVMLAALIGSTIFFVLTVSKAFGIDKRYGAITVLIILLFSIHFVIDKNEAFFWWNGCSYYTLFYSFSLVFLALLIRMYIAEKKGGRTICFIIALLLGAVIAGGNYTTALLTIMLTCFIIGVVYKSKKRLLPYYIAVLIVLSTGFVVSMAAPGNGVRADQVTGMSPVKAILDSVYYAIVFIADWTRLPQLAGFAVISAFALTATENSRYRFRYPLLVFIVSLLVFAAQLTPPLYAMSSYGSGRQVNIYYYAYYLFVAFNVFYLCGWLNKNGVIKTENIKLSHALCGLVVLAIAFIGSVVGFGYAKVTFADALMELKDGVPQAYSAEYKNVISQIKRGDTAVSEIETIPDFFAPLGIQEDPDYWVNKQIAQYYEVDQVTLKPE